MYCDVSLHLSKDKTAIYTYKCNDELPIGSQVIVQVQHKYKVGIVVDLKDVITSKYQIKEIVAVLNKQPLNQYQNKLFEQIHEQTICSYIKCYELFVKPINDSKIDFEIYKDGLFIDMLSDVENKKEFKNNEYSLIPKIKYKQTAATYQYVQVSNDFEYKLSDKQKKLVSYVEECDEILVSDLINQTEFSRSMINTLVKHQVLTQTFKTKQFDTLFEFQWHGAHKLTAMQQLVSSEISEAELPSLLYGVSSSGKTEIYIDLIKQQIAANKQSLVLVPSVSLAIQVIGKMQRHFSDVIIFHRNLTEDQRLVYMDKITSGEAKVVVSTVDGVFLPFHDLGIAIFDEAHDNSYDIKRGINIPKEVLIDSLHKNKTKVVLGSATPDILDYAKAKREAYHLAKLTTRFGNSNLPQVEFVKPGDNKLDELININKTRNKPTLIYYNHSGYAKQIMCSDCYHIQLCPNCQKPLSYSSRTNSYECKYDGYRQKFNKVCPNCSSRNLQYLGVGIEQYTENIRNLYPDLVIEYIDNKLAHDQLYKLMAKFGSGEIDILIGTRTIAFGIDFLNIDNVYIVNSDSLLFLNETSAAEITYQMLEQVAGRAGRASQFSNAYIETNYPDNYVYQAIQSHDFEQFYNHEMSLRKALKQQPYYNFCKIEITDRNSKKLEYVGAQLVAKLKAHKLHVTKIQTPYIELRYNTYRRYFLIRYRYENIKQIIETELSILDENNIGYSIDIKNKEIGV